MASEKKRPRTYGNWRRPSSPGLGRLGFGGTIAFLGGMILVIIMMAISLKAGLITLVLVSLGLAPLVVKDLWGRTLYEVVALRFSWIAHRRRGHHKYVAGPLSRTPETRCALPGLATGISVSEARDAHQQPFVMLHHRRPGHVATVLECAPSGADLVGPRRRRPVGIRLGSLARGPRPRIRSRRRSSDGGNRTGHRCPVTPGR